MHLPEREREKDLIFHVIRIAILGLSQITSGYSKVRLCIRMESNNRTTT